MTIQQWLRWRIRKEKNNIKAFVVRENYGIAAECKTRLESHVSLLNLIKNGSVKLR